MRSRGPSAAPCPLQTRAYPLSREWHEPFDVVVIGGGNAALCAAISAHESGASVLVIERAPKDHRGGNSAFTGGAFRIAYDGVDDLRQLIPDLHPDEIRDSDFGTYTEDQFYDEAIAMSGYRADADVLQTVVRQSMPTMLWLTHHGVRFVPDLQPSILQGRRQKQVLGRSHRGSVRWGWD